MLSSLSPPCTLSHDSATSTNAAKSAVESAKAIPESASAEVDVVSECVHVLSVSASGSEQAERRELIMSASCCCFVKLKVTPKAFSAALSCFGVR